MTELAFTRDPADRRAYVVDGYGSLRLAGRWRRDAVATAPDGRTWTLRRVGFGRRAEATDATGAAVAWFAPAGLLGRGGRLAVGDREYTLRPSSLWRERYALADGDTELAAFEASGWGGKRPVKVAVQAPVDPLVLLTAGWLVKTFADDSAASSAGATTAAVSAG
jgi:YD repeat-containing protein